MQIIMTIYRLVLRLLSWSAIMDSRCESRVHCRYHRGWYLYRTLPSPHRLYNPVKLLIQIYRLLWLDSLMDWSTFVCTAFVCTAFVCTAFVCTAFYVQHLYVQHLYVQHLYVQHLYVKHLYVQHLYVQRLYVQHLYVLAQDYYTIEFKGSRRNWTRVIGMRSHSMPTIQPFHMWRPH